MDKACNVLGVAQGEQMTEDTNRIRVLVIDGSRNVRDYVAEQVLVPNGYEPVLARDGAEGLRKALTEIPDLILMDYELPMMSGRDVLEALRARPFRVPIILMTSRGSEQIAVWLIRMGVRDFLIKPFTADELLQSIKRALFEVQLRREKATLADRLAQAERKIRQYLFEISVFSEIGQAVTAHMPLEALLGRIADAALFITRAEECILVLNDPETGHQTDKVKKRRTGGIARPLIPYASPAPNQPGAVVAMLHIPLRVGSREIGVLSVNNKATPRAFSDHDRQMLRILADYAAIAAESARLLGRLEGAEGPEQSSPAS